MRQLATDIHERYFRAAQAQPRGAVAKLGEIVAQLELTVQRQRSGAPNDHEQWRPGLAAALDQLTELLAEEGLISAFELHSSGLVQALLALLSGAAAQQPGDQPVVAPAEQRLRKQRLRAFRKCFLAGPAAAVLVHKLIAVLESIERLPVYLYDCTPGVGGYGLQVSHITTYLHLVPCCFLAVVRFVF